MKKIEVLCVFEPTYSQLLQLLFKFPKMTNKYTKLKNYTCMVYVFIQDCRLGKG